MIVLGRSPSAFAQTGSATLTGIIQDQSGAALPGAAVEVTGLETNLSRSAVTTRAGVYAFAGLPSATYRVRVMLAGFRPVIRDAVQLHTGQTMRLDIELVVGNVSETLTVTGALPILRAESSSLGQVVDHDKIVQLPLNGRSFIALASLAPGVAVPPGSQLPRINGGRPRTNEYLFDGISVLQPEPGQVAFFPVVDAIQEFKIESNSPPAEFGRFNGGVVNLTTKAGSNTFHGVGFEFLRNETLNAKHVFASADPVKPMFRRNQFGGTLGGPILKDRTFFFLDYQGQRQTIGRTVISTVPTLLQRRGVFTELIGGRVPIIYDPSTTTVTDDGAFSRRPFADNAIPVGRIDPVARELLQRYPLPTSAGTANNYHRTDNETNHQEQFDVRIDHRVGRTGSQAFARLSNFHDRFVPVSPLPEGSGVTAGTPGPQDTKAWAFASNYQHIFSDRWLNELRGGDTSRAIARRAARLSGPASNALNIPGIPSYAQFPDSCRRS